MSDRITAVSGEGEGEKFEAMMARTVLEDCRAALRELQSEPSGQAWRIRWVAVLGLLRTVRDVLTRVDGISEDVHPALREEIRKFPSHMKETKPEPEIYWEFICGDANNILHYYNFSAVQSVRLPLDNGDKSLEVSASAKTRVSVVLQTREAPAERIYRMKTGPFKDQDQRHVVEKAIDWWQEQIEEMEDRAAASVFEKGSEPALATRKEPCRSGASS